MDADDWESKNCIQYYKCKLVKKKKMIAGGGGGDYEMSKLLAEKKK